MRDKCCQDVSRPAEPTAQCQRVSHGQVHVSMPFHSSCCVQSCSSLKRSPPTPTHYDLPFRNNAYHAQILRPPLSSRTMNGFGRSVFSAAATPPIPLFVQCLAHPPEITSRGSDMYALSISHYFSTLSVVSMHLRERLVKFSASVHLQPAMDLIHDLFHASRFVHISLLKCRGLSAAYKTQPLCSLLRTSPKGWRWLPILQWSSVGSLALHTFHLRCPCILAGLYFHNCHTHDCLQDNDERLDI